MPEFKFVIANPKTRKSYQVSIDQDKAVGLIGKKIKENFNGDILGLKGYEIQITGGTDKDGFPMHPSVRGPVRKKIILSSSPGFHPKRKGMRKRKMVRGDTIDKNIVQINCKIIKEGSEKVEELLGKKEEKPKEEAPKEEVKPKPKEESKKEESKKEEKKEQPKKEEKPKEQPKKEEKPKEEVKDEKK
ncbi:MAG: 30S ribosomal protein S6e [Candidatus Aenigmarchaeota archaeon]|nr:30S ribosomal protein S6e [Candidatus Aenigmarchaeota archaeon]